MATLASLVQRKPRVLPGLSLSLGITVFFVSIIILLPLAGLTFQLAQLDFDSYVRIMSSERVLKALEVTVTAAGLATVFNGVFGFLVAWVLVRYNFPGRSILDAIIDLPFALPTAVAGIALVSLYDKNGWMGQLLEPLGIQIAYSWFGIVIAMTFTSFPFAVRALQPAIEELDPDEERAAMTLGARQPQLFFRVIFRPLMPALLTGVGLSFVRSLGEFGAVIFIAGNMPFQTEIASLLVLIRLDEFDYPAAAAIAGTLLGLSLVLLTIINIAQTRLYAYTKEAR